MNKWKETAVMNYYYRESDGRILGSVWHFAMNSAVYSSKIFTETFPFTNECEKFLGHYITEDAAKQSVETFWLRQEKLLEMK